jgi:hypothetical protein
VVTGGAGWKPALDLGGAGFQPAHHLQQIQRSEKPHGLEARTTQYK